MQKMEEKQAMMETQLAAQARAPGTLPGNTQANPKGQLQAVTLRSGKELEVAHPKEPKQKEKVQEEEKEDEAEQVNEEGKEEPSPISSP